MIPDRNAIMMQHLHQESVNMNDRPVKGKGWCVMEWKHILKVVKKIARAVETVIDIWEN